MYLGLVVLVIVLCFWSTLVQFAPSLDTKRVVGIGVAVLAGFIFYFDKKLDQFKASATTVFHMDISDAIRKAIESKRGRVKVLRISAITSEVILPILRDVRIHIGECRIMLHRFDERGRIKDAGKLNGLVADLRSKWRELQRAGTIGQLKVVLYDDVPMKYVITFDADVALFGGYAPDDESPHGNDFREPYVLLASSVENERVILKENDWFDTYFAYWESREESVSSSFAKGTQLP